MTGAIQGGSKELVTETSCVPPLVACHPVRFGGVVQNHGPGARHIQRRDARSLVVGRPGQDLSPYWNMEPWFSCSTSVLGAAPVRCCELLQTIASAPLRPSVRWPGDRSQSLSCVSCRRADGGGRAPRGGAH